MGKHGWEWFGILINIPISIVVGLCLPKLQRWIEDRGKSSHAKKLSRQKEEYEDAMHYALHPDRFLGKMLHLVMYLVIYILMIVATNTFGSEIIVLFFGLVGPVH